MIWRLVASSLDVLLLITLVTGLLAVSVDPLSDLAPVAIPFWVACLGVFFTGILIAILIVDLKRTFLTAIGVGVAATITYILVLWTPAIMVPEHSTRLMNFGLVYSVLIGMMAIVLLAVGAVTGMAINAGVRDIEM